MEAYDRQMADWCATTMRRLRNRAARPDDELPELDRLVNSFPYHFGDISAWPDDMVLIHSSAFENLYLGSLAALRSLDETKGVNIVISLCAAEMKSIKGQPEHGWKKLLSDMSIEHLEIDLDDPRTKLPGENGYCEELANQYFATWQRMCVQLTRILLGRSTKETTGLLFHCFGGGVNRSSAALVAWLIFQHDLSAEAAIEMALSVRPSLRPWEKRPHILWALKTWEAKAGCSA